MPANYDEKAGSWTAQFYYTDYTGTRKKKFKRGFKLKKDALEWERVFLEKQQADINMSFKSFVELYFEDMRHRLRASTVDNKRYIVDLKITPFFSQMQLSQIKAADVRRWQNEMISVINDRTGKPYSATYLKSINNQLTAIFNYAVKYYDLKENPCHKAGSMGKKEADEMEIWTHKEFKCFISAFEDRPQSRLAFEMLYFTGLRIGELMALTPVDIDLKAKTVSVTKSLQRLNKADVITAPKTPKSLRVISLPDFLCNDLAAYMRKIYGGPGNNERIFDFNKWFLKRELERGCKHTGVKKIRLHDLRHSHASLLIELGFSPLLIAERLGHEKVETTLNTYAHLYPNKQSEVAEKLENYKL
ncbi:MAG: tyrosine-type recombinase/integrase [Eubacterium callanderi]|uniref:tyrosine-type recombinase/integrase n=1 Tax=Eubacterium callanderi TaxID=53442 RepID=UPI0039921F66